MDFDCFELIEISDLGRMRSGHISVTANRYIFPVLANTMLVSNIANSGREIDCTLQTPRFLIVCITLIIFNIKSGLLVTATEITFQ